MAEFFGDIERGLAQLYPYRWPILFGILLVVTGVVAYSYRKGWHLNVWRHRVAVAIVGTPALAAVLVAGWYLGAPLFTSKTVIEEFPFAFTATVPSTMTRGDVEKTMASIAKFDEKVSEGMLLSKTGATAAAKIKSGSFRNADGFHKGSGEATIYRGPDGSRLLRLENFSVTNGPALHVILSPHSGPDTSGEVKSPGYADLGRLKGNKGDQNYPIPDEVDVDSQMSVVIYCKPFSVVFSVAMLQDAEFPFASNAVVPLGMSLAGVEQIMSSMANFDQEISEEMSGPSGISAQGGNVLRAGLALAKGGTTLVSEGVEASDDALADEGMAMFQKGSEMLGSLMIPDDGLAMIHDGMETSDDAMIAKGMVMVEDALKAAETAVAEQASVVKLKTGNFRDADSFHRGRGQATIYRGPDGSRVLRLENLDVTNGPDLHVIITPHENPTRGSEVKTTGYWDLGKLKGNKGDQNYPIPDDVDISEQRTVVIYCVPFSVVFSTAALQDVN